jgi:hypothetical protein
MILESSSSVTLPILFINLASETDLNWNKSTTDFLIKLFTPSGGYSTIQGTES